MAIINNSYVVMWCYVRDDEVEVYDCVDHSDDESEEYRALWCDKQHNVFHPSKLGEHVMTFKAQKIFIGRCDCPEDRVCCGEMRDGHGLLCEVKDNTYICISACSIERFKALDGNGITSFTSSVGPNGVPYPTARSDTFTYFLLKGCAVRNSSIPEGLSSSATTGVDLYDWFYEEVDKKKTVEIVEYDVEELYALDY